MAINPETQYPGQIAPSDADYPFGSARNITTPGDGTGTPWEAALVNDVFGFQQALLDAAGIVPSGTPDKVTASQYLEALNDITSRVFDTLTLAKAATNKAGILVKTRGFASAGNGGDAFYLVLTAAQFGGTPDEKGDHTDGGGNVLVLQEIPGNQRAMQYGAVNDEATNNTAIVQAMVDKVLATDARSIFVEDGCQFDLTALVFNKDTDISYRANDELNSPSESGQATNERVLYKNNDNVSGDVNEQQFAAALHPGHVLDARQDTPNRGAGSQVGLASYLTRLMNQNQWQWGRREDGQWTLVAWERIFTIDLGTDDFAVNPVVGDEMNGDTSGCVGNVRTIAATTMTVTLTGGTGLFEVGETITVTAGSTSTSSIGSVTRSYTTREKIVSSNDNTTNGVNMALANATHQWTVGGILGIETGRGGQFGAPAAGLRIFDDLAAPTVGFRWGLNGGTNELELFWHSGAKVWQISSSGIMQVGTVRASSAVQTPTIFVDTVPTSGSDPKIVSGTGSPEGVVAAGPGSIYFNKSGGASTSLFVKESGTGNTGWVAK